MGKKKTYCNKFTSKLTCDIPVGGKMLYLVRELIFWDENGRRWCVPNGEHANGASFDADKKKLKWLGRFIMFFVGAPLGDFWVWASVLHDYYCRVGESLGIESQDVHDMFYCAMLVCIDMMDITENLKKKKRRTAKLFYKAVSRFGPRW